MFGSLTQLRGCDAYLRSTATSLVHRSNSGPTHQAVESPRRVLIVEFRDEVFANLKSIVEDHGCEVARAATGTSVAAQVKRFVPDLLLVNEIMPDESGWLITCKLRLARQHEPVWLYAVRKPQVHTDWKETIGVDEILAYGGVLSRLNLGVRERLESWLELPVAGIQREEESQAVAAGLGKCA